MKTTRVLFALLLFPLFSFSSARPDTSGHFLKPGDKMPDVPFRIHNYKAPTAKISDFKGKAVIIDLWGVYCSSCIAAIPHMQKLQNKFGNKLQIIMATRDEPAKVAKLANHSDNVKNNKLPCVMGDDSLAYLFDYTFLPTEVWINEDGIIKHISGGSDVTDKNIIDFISGKGSNIKQKIDINIDRNKPLLVSWYPFYDSIGIYCYITPAETKYSTAGGVSIRKNPEKNIERLTIDKSSIKDLYKYAYNAGSISSHYYSDNRVIIDLKGQTNYAEKMPKQFTYEMICNVSRPDIMIYKFMQFQLDLYFNFHSYIAKRQTSCFIIRRLGDNDTSFISKGGQVKGSYNNGVYKGQNIAWWNIFRSNISGSRSTPLQVIDETGITPQTKVDISFNLNHWNNLPLLNKELAHYGLKVIKEKRMLDCIVIEDAK